MIEKLPSTAASFSPRTAGPEDILVFSQGETLTISAIVPAHLGGEAFARCLQSVLQTDPPPDEVLVVADGSAEAARQARAMGARVLLVTVRRGPAFARNLGARQARGDIAAF